MLSAALSEEDGGEQGEAYDHPGERHPAMPLGSLQISPAGLGEILWRNRVAKDFELERAVIKSSAGFQNVCVRSQIIQDHPHIVEGDPDENAESDKPDRQQAVSKADHFTGYPDDICLCRE